MRKVVDRIAEVDCQANEREHSIVSKSLNILKYLHKQIFFSTATSVMIYYSKVCTNTQLQSQVGNPPTGFNSHKTFPTYQCFIKNIKRLCFCTDYNPEHQLYKQRNMLFIKKSLKNKALFLIMQTHS